MHQTLAHRSRLSSPPKTRRRPPGPTPADAFVHRWQLAAERCIAAAFRSAPKTILTVRERYDLDACFAPGDLLRWHTWLAVAACAEGGIEPTEYLVIGAMLQNRMIAESDDDLVLEVLHGWGVSVGFEHFAAELAGFASKYRQWKSRDALLAPDDGPRATMPRPRVHVPRRVATRLRRQGGHR